ncbi:MAG: hypothetical protein PUE18_03405 [Firmicutes bacterium]|nr:hypothetical protein [Bacillota bacterium]
MEEKNELISIDRRIRKIIIDWINDQNDYNNKAMLLIKENIKNIILSNHKRSK